jgi:hypothetical protein
MWEYICLNSHPEIIKLINNNFSSITKIKNSRSCIENICLNSGAQSIIENNFDFLYSKGMLVFISQNEHASSILMKHLDKVVEFQNLKFIIPNLVAKCHQNKNIINQIFTHPNKTEYSWDIWIYLCRCDNLVNLIFDNLELISQYPTSMYDLCGNPEAITIIKNFLPSFNSEWYQLSENPAIFEPDYDFLSNRIQIFEEQLISKIFHPKKILYFLERYNYDLGEEDYFEND